MRTRIKICGVTRAEDALAAAEAGADAVGFMLYPGSKRFVTWQQAESIGRVLPPFVAKVGVFVNASEEEIRRTVRQCGLNSVQLHGEESPGCCDALADLCVVKAFRVKDRAILETLPAYRTRGWLLDSHVEGSRGGTGAMFDWEIAAAAARLGTPVILAGGLKPGNVAEAVRATHPYGVDVSSGVESAPGIKDADLIRRFVTGVQAGDSVRVGAG